MTFPEGLDLVLRILAIPFLLLANAFFVAVEFGVVAVRPTRTREMVEKGVPRARLLQRAVADRERVIAATQVGITIASLALGWVGEPVLARFLDAILSRALGASASLALSHGAAVAVAFSLITFLHVLLGEQVPKTIALQRPAQTGLVLAGPYLVTERLFRPLVWVLSVSGGWVVRRIGLKPLPASQRVHSADELRMLVDASLQGGALAPDHGAILARALELPVRRVSEIMVARDRIAAVDVRTPQDRLLEFVAEEGHTRLPVYDGSLDRVVGIVHTKDIFTITASRGLIILDDLLREPFFVAPDMDVAEVLRGFRNNSVHLALVRDAGGRIVGLVTLEDVLQQLVGHIEDLYKIDREDLPGEGEGEPGRLEKRKEVGPAAGGTATG